VRPTTKAFLWGAVAGVVGTWLLHVVMPSAKAVAQPKSAAS
jgi:hypothetical protein